ncbi:hypothetical protein OAG15_02195 [bacterium]|nr:hypothetical protein [bacterium]
MQAAHARQLLYDRFVLLHRLKPCLAITGTENESSHGIVVTLADRIELVVVTAGTGHGQTEESLAQDIDLVVDAVTFVQTKIYRGTVFLAKERPGSGEDRFVGTRFRMPPRGFQEVAGEVLLD